MYRGKLWTMRQFAGFGTLRRTPTNASTFFLGRGQTGLSTAFDMPTLMGYDADHETIALGEVGREGVSVSSLADMEVLFDGIRLDQGDDLDDGQLLGQYSSWLCTSPLRRSRA